MRARNCNFFLMLSLFFAAVSIPENAQANPNFKYWPVSETMPDGRVHFRVIEEDPSLRANQNQISERVIEDEILPMNEVPKDISSIIAHAKIEAFPKTGKPLWVPTKNSWSQADEDAYSAWFASIDNTYNNGGIPADCADTGLLFRWTYAREHLLPIANTLIGGKLFGHFSSDASWDTLPTNPDWKQDQRFKAAMTYLFNHTYTHTVIGDIYPTVVSSQYVRPGSMFMIIRATDGHTQTIHQIGNDVGVITFWGNEPAAAEIFETQIDIETENKMTIGLWREVRLNAQKVWELTPAAEMPGYSLAQFQQTFNNDSAYEDWFFSQIGITVSNAQKLQDLLDSFIGDLVQRKTETANSVAFCVPTQCAPNSAEYNNDSTPALDAKIVSEQKQLADLMQIMRPNDPAVIQVMQSLQMEGEVVRGSGLTFLSLATTPSMLANFNSDPRVSYEARWGISATTADQKFNNGYDVLYDLLNERDDKVIQAYYLCAASTKPCDPNSAAVKSLNTGALDAAIVAYYQKLQNDAPIGQVDAGTVQSVRQEMLWNSIGVVDASCTNQMCTFDDLLFGSNPSTHFKVWTPVPTDTLPKRWGY